MSRKTGIRQLTESLYTLSKITSMRVLLLVMMIAALLDDFPAPSAPGPVVHPAVGDEVVSLPRLNS